MINDELYSKLAVIENYYKCIYDEEYNRCKEEYNSWEDYIFKKVATDKDICISIILWDKTKKCVYDNNKVEFVTKPIFMKNMKIMMEKIKNYMNQSYYSHQLAHIVF